MSKPSVIQDFKSPVLKLSKPVSVKVFQTHQKTQYDIQTFDSDVDNIGPKKTPYYLRSILIILKKGRD